jgi:hypothetical protein
MKLTSRQDLAPPEHLEYGFDVTEIQTGLDANDIPVFHLRLRLDRRER